MNLRLFTMALMALMASALPALTADEPTVRLPDDQARRLVTSRVDPEYPAMARQLRLAGAVQVDVFLDPDGNVEKVQVVNGHPLLSGATVAAIKRWHFSAYQNEGKAARVVVRYTVNFKL